MKKCLSITITLTCLVPFYAFAVNCHRLREYNSQTGRHELSAQWTCTLNTTEDLREMFHFRATSRFYQNCKLTNIDTTRNRFTALCYNQYWRGRRMIYGYYASNLVDYYPYKNSNYFSGYGANHPFTHQYMAKKTN